MIAPAIAPLWPDRSAALLRALLGRQGRDEGLLRHLDPADDLHPALAFLLPLQQLALAGDVAAVALGEHVLAHRADVLPRDHPRADGRHEVSLLVALFLFFLPFFGGLFATLADPTFAVRIVPESQLRPLAEAYRQGFESGRGPGLDA